MKRTRASDRRAKNPQRIRFGSPAEVSPTRWRREIVGRGKPELFKEECGHLSIIMLPRVNQALRNGSASHFRDDGRHLHEIGAGTHYIADRIHFVSAVDFSE